MRLFIEATRQSPEVTFDLIENRFEVKGRSLPENAREFYEVLVNWLLKNAAGHNQKTSVNFILEYYNTGSYIGLMSVLNTLVKLNAKGCNFVVCWYCAEDDDDAVDDANSFKEVVSIPFDIRLVDSSVF